MSIHIYLALHRIRWGRAIYSLCEGSSPPPAAWRMIRIRTCDLQVTKHEPLPLHQPATLLRLALIFISCFIFFAHTRGSWLLVYHSLDFHQHWNNSCFIDRMVGCFSTEMLVWVGRNDLLWVRLLNCELGSVMYYIKRECGDVSLVKSFHWCVEFICL